MKNGLIIDLNVPYFSSFRKPDSTAFLESYPIVPFTTIRGLLSNALGLQRNDFYLHDNISLGLTPLEFGEKNQEFAKIIKFTGSGQRGSSASSFPSSPMYREFLVGGKYRIYISSEDNKLLEKLDKRMKYPKRPLYIGRSDEMVVIDNVEKVEINQGKTKIAHSIIKGVIPECRLLRMPLKFNGTDELVYTDTISIPKNYPKSLSQHKKLWNFSGEWVELFE